MVHCSAAAVENRWKMKNMTVRKCGEYEAVYRNIYRAYDISGKWSGVWILLFQ